MSRPRSESSRVVWLALAAATALKLYLALTTAGTLDAAGFADHLSKIEQLGGLGAYRVRGAFNNPFNSPPFMIHALRAMGWLARATRLPFPFWLRLPCVAADVGSFLLVRRLLARALPGRDQTAPLLLLALSPVSIIISGYHGNTDPVMIFFVLLAAELCERKGGGWAAGLALGLALNVKAAPLLFAPALALYLPTWRARARFCGAAAAAWFVGSLPYVVQDPPLVARAVLGYGSIYGVWGWTYFVARLRPQTVAFAHPPFDVVGEHATYVAAGKLLLVALVVASSVWMNRRGRRVPLLVQCGLTASLFLALAPGFGTQYLVWLVPWVAALALWAALAYHLTAGVYLFLSYTCFWQAACADEVLSSFRLAAWVASLVALACYFRFARRRARLPRAAPPRL